MPERQPAPQRVDSTTAAERALCSGFWVPKTIEQFAAEQGVSLPQDIDALIGQGAELWEDDEDLERFLAAIAERRGPHRRQPA